MRRICVGLVSLFLLCAACNDVTRATGPGTGGPPVHLARLLTGAAAAALLPNGAFALPTQFSGGLSAEQAGELAVVYGRTVGHLLAPAWNWERQAGAIHPGTLTRCGRIYLAVNAFVELPASASRALQQRVEPQWLVTLCSPAGEPEVSIGVPVRDTSLHITADSVITNLGIANFSSTGLPEGRSAPSTSPEEAAREVAIATGRLVAAVPELVLPPPPYLPQLAKWRISLDAPATVVNGAARSETSASELYVGYCHAAAPSCYGLWMQAHDSSASPRSQLLLRSGDASVPLTLRPSYAVAFTRVDGEAK